MDFAPDISSLLAIGTIFVALPVLLAVAGAWRRGRLARHVNQKMVRCCLPFVEGPLREAVCGAMLGAALAEAALLPLSRRPRWVVKTRQPRSLDGARYAVMTQVMLCAARSLQPDGAISLRHYGLELAYLSRYAYRASGAMQAVARRFRQRTLSDDLGSRFSQSVEALLCAVPIALAWHHRPPRAAELSAATVALSHRSAAVREGARNLAAAIVRAIPGRAGPSMDSRRAWLEAVLCDADTLDSARSVALFRAADLAVEPLSVALEHFSSGSCVDEVMPVALYLALRHKDAPMEALAEASKLGRQARYVAPLALAIIGAHVGASALPEALVQALQDRQLIELWGEKIAVFEPK
ncbi:MAG: hypothetical protein AUK47_24045 [Deltaproteobacteria bacterium CG2_30_63_29]|nr:MAG: hypothetical protein AUK47_24045 [Deltaproteobacteria bacterium CG2_30_63_29]PJB35919.1 MAG: hypothetical protein CO108_24635 [Deltaproteobacteria bacterium CG_4_9_14_3_um_filter_63_12]